MKMMIWKELRENLKWAVLAMIGLGLAEFYGLFYKDANEINNGPGVVLCKATFLMATSYGCALAGILLGFLQILPEQRRDQWAALLHRPVSRGLILQGKIVAGLLLYVMATVPAFLICVWFAATPGHFVSPFLPDMVLPGLSDAILGAVFYFAALLVTLQRGSWMGVRMLAIFAAVHASFYASSAAYFSEAVGVAIAMTSVLYLAAWGAMLSNGQLRSRPLIAKLALVAVSFYGLCGLGDLALMMSKAGVQEYSRLSQEYQFTLEGEPLIVTTKPDLSIEVTDLEGRAINDERYRSAGSYENFLNLAQVSTYIGDPRDINRGYFYRHFRNGFTYTQPIRLYSQFPLPVQWFYLREQRYFVGISNQNKMPVGIADREGFKPWGAVPVPFKSRERSYLGGVPTVVTEGDTCYSYDFIHEKQMIIKSPDGGPIYQSETVSYVTMEKRSYETVISLALAHELAIYDLTGKLITTLPYHQDVSIWGDINLGIGAGLSKYFVEYEPSLWMSWEERHKLPNYYEEVDVHGNILKPYVLPPLHVDIPPRPWIETFSDTVQAPAMKTIDVMWKKICDAAGWKWEKAYINPYRPEATSPKWIWKLIVPISLALAVVTFFLAKWARFSTGRTWAWTMFVFAFNLGGLITFWLVEDWSVKVKCPQCSQKRPVEEEVCPDCQAAWPGEKPSGIEIFEEKELVVEKV